MGLTSLQKRGGLFLPGAFVEVGGEKPASLVEKQRIDTRGEIFSGRLGWISTQKVLSNNRSISRQKGPVFAIGAFNPRLMTDPGYPFIGTGR
jgi:hypothetical protein